MLKTMFPGLGLESSALGFGCMRFPTNEDKTIDEAQAIAMLRHAIDSGVTYIDTAYPYHGGQSEIVVGKALRDGYRDRVILATKCPMWDVKTHEDMMRLLDEQLAKLQTDHVDFYLLHAMNKERLELARRVDYKSFFAQALAEGKIRYPAFSFHDDAETFLEVLNDYDGWKMCQVQMNLLDDEAQATMAGIREAGRKGVGVVVMEPLRGGLLSSPPQEIADIYARQPGQKRSPVEWAFRYLYTQPEVVTILSGMSTPEQLEDNLDIFSRADREPLTEEENVLFRRVKQAYLDRTKIRCTGCRYCQPCPMEVHIPDIFRRYDDALMFGRGFERAYQQLEGEGHGPTRCVGCGKCERACPQHLPIISLLKDIRLEQGAEK